jgi:hypothetical protein
MASDLVPELALISSGEFLMGSDDAEDDEKARSTASTSTTFFLPSSRSPTPTTRAS